MPIRKCKSNNRSSPDYKSNEEIVEDFFVLLAKQRDRFQETLGVFADPSRWDGKTFITDLDEPHLLAKGALDIEEI